MDPSCWQTMSKSLTNEAVFRIELSLSSRRSSAIVMRTQARLYSLDKGSTEAATPSELVMTGHTFELVTTFK